MLIWCSGQLYRIPYPQKVLMYTTYQKYIIQEISKEGEYVGWIPSDLHFCVSACGNNKELARGESYDVFSPKQPDGRYVNDANCRWSFAIQDASKPAKLLVTVKSNDLADAGSCGDYMELKPASGKAVKLCGNKSLNDSWTISDKLVVIFRSNAANVAKGTDLHISSKVY